MNNFYVGLPYKWGSGSSTSCAIPYTSSTSRFFDHPFRAARQPLLTRNPHDGELWTLPCKLIPSDDRRRCERRHDVSTVWGSPSAGSYAKTATHRPARGKTCFYARTVLLSKFWERCPVS
ncbi:hypothetical protein FHG87_002308 [Trinorchestia longiramus]|nr:hypothetical protein FHG87_002308 [Trinorchestia longiramus]